MTVSKTGYLYWDTVLIPHREGTVTVYAGKLRGREAKFTVTADKTVTFRYDGTDYGPYTAREDPTAIPDDMDADLTDEMTGVEVRLGEEILFRGGVRRFADDVLLFREEGGLVFDQIVYSGQPPLDAKPSVLDLLKLMSDQPPLTHKGDWMAWWGSVGLSVVTALSILFADKIFRWNLSFQIRDPERAEPSDWELGSRVLSWLVLTVAIFVLYIAGLQ